MKANQIAGETT